ncbi:MAG: glycosyltransferase family 39 protein [Phycisphaerales bacterium]|nr:glycosyltransferase family 39 protein [Phycisphaerales bacterium]
MDVSPQRLLFTVFAVALAARAGWGVFRMMRSPEPVALEFPDEEQYWMMARSFAEGHGLRDELGFRATRMPLYPGFLALFVELPGGAAYARAVQWIIGAMAASLTAGLATSLAGRRIGAIAGLMVALDPFLIFFASLLLTETLFITSLCGLWWLLARVIRRGEGHSFAGTWLAIGALASLCVYARESSLGLILAALLFVALMRRFDHRVLAGTATVLGVVVISLIPWVVRNHSLTGDWCWLTYRGGISLYDGVGPRATGESDLGDIKQSPAVRDLGEAEWDRHFRREAIAAIKADPARVLRLAGAKLLRMWNPFPNVETYRSAAVRAVSAAWTIPLFALAVGGAFAWSITTRGHGFCLTLFLLLPAFYLSALHSLFIGSVRYRLPAMPMIAVLAATGLSFLLFGRRSPEFDESAQSTTETP